MKTVSDSFVKASFTLCGTACIVLALQVILREIFFSTGWRVPGFGYAAGLCWHLFFLWAGLLLRRILPEPRRWVRALVLCAATLLLLRYQLYAEGRYWTVGLLFLSILGYGFLIPPESLDNAGREPGWAELALLVSAVFCCVTLMVSADRIQWGDVFGDRFRDMERLLERILSLSEPLSVLLVVYFSARVSFSRAGLRLGGQKWFRWIGVVTSVILFVSSLGYCIPFSAHRWPVLLRLAVQPVTVVLLIGSVRAISDKASKNDRRNGTGTKLSPMRDERTNDRCDMIENLYTDEQ